MELGHTYHNVLSGFGVGGWQHTMQGHLAQTNDRTTIIVRGCCILDAGEWAGKWEHEKAESSNTSMA